MNRPFKNNSLFCVSCPSLYKINDVLSSMLEGLSETCCKLRYISGKNLIIFKIVKTRRYKFAFEEFFTKTKGEIQNRELIICSLIVIHNIYIYMYIMSYFHYFHCLSFIILFVNIIINISFIKFVIPFRYSQFISLISHFWMLWILFSA